MSSRAAEFNNKIQQKYGEQSQVESKMKEIAREMHNPRYSEAKKNYLKKLIERTVITSSIQVSFRFSLFNFLLLYKILTILVLNNRKYFTLLGLNKVRC